MCRVGVGPLHLRPGIRSEIDDRRGILIFVELFVPVPHEREREGDQA